MYCWHELIDLPQGHNVDHVGQAYLIEEHDGIVAFAVEEGGATGGRGMVRVKHKNTVEVSLLGLIVEMGVVGNLAHGLVKICSVGRAWG
jgi:hypothetical protein